MAFELPIMETAFALSEFEFKVFTLAIDFQFRIVTFGNGFFNFILELLLLENDFWIWVLTFNGHSRPPYQGVQHRKSIHLVTHPDINPVQQGLTSLNRRNPVIPVGASRTRVRTD